MSSFGRLSLFLCVCVFYVFFYIFNVILNVNRQFICSQNVFYVFYTDISKQFEQISMGWSLKMSLPNNRKQKTQNTHRISFISDNRFEKCVLLLPSKYNVLFGICTMYTLYTTYICILYTHTQCDVLICWFQNGIS